MTLHSDRKLLLHFRTSYFTQVGLGQERWGRRSHARQAQPDVHPRCLLLQWGEHVAVCGEGPLFGNWDVKK